MEVAQIARDHGVRQETLICSRIDERTKQDTRNRNKTINSVPPTNRQANGTASLVLCGV